MDTQMNVGEVISMVIALGSFLVFLPFMCFGIWDRCLENSDPLRALNLKSERMIFRQAVYRDFKRLVGRHLRK